MSEMGPASTGVCHVISYILTYHFLYVYIISYIRTYTRTYATSLNCVTMICAKINPWL